MIFLPVLAVFCCVFSVVCLLLLHLFSPEFKPSWRMISEYALGKYKVFLTVFFIFWGLANIITAIWMWEQAGTFLSKIGIILLMLSGVGAIMGGLFDVKHKLHGLSFVLGIPTLLIGVILISYHFITFQPWEDNKLLILISTHAIWLSCILMAVSMGIMFYGFKKSGIDFGPDAPVPSSVPDGVIALAGYANRLIVLVYIFYVFIFNYIYFQYLLS